MPVAFERRNRQQSFREAAEERESAKKGFIMDERKSLILEERKGDMVAGHGFTRRTFIKGSAAIGAMAAISGTTLGVLSSCSTSAGDGAVTFENITEGVERRLKPNAISFTEARTFKMVVPIGGSKEEIQEKIDGGSIAWELVREAGQQDVELFPHQWLGGPLGQWKTVATKIQPETDFFSGVSTTVEEVDGVTSVVLVFSNNLLFGYDGIDNRDRKLVRDSILDWTGVYTLKCIDGENEIASVEVPVRPYDSYATFAEIAEELPGLVQEANENGLYAELQTIGQSADGRDIYAVIIAKEQSDVENYRSLSDRMKSEPAKVQEEVNTGSLSYKVPIMYSNIHSDETPGSDGVMEFLRLLAANQPIEYNYIGALTKEGVDTLSAEMNRDSTDWSLLVADQVSGVGYIRGEGVKNPTYPGAEEAEFSLDPFDLYHMTVDMAEDEFGRYYEVEKRTFDPAQILDQVFFLLVPVENPDGRTYNTRTNGNGFDLNRDNTYQTQPETQAMTKFIASWNPISLHEIHGFYTQYQVEPCTPPHDPNNEYDLFIDTAVSQGEAFISASIANNVSINSAQMPMRDYLKILEDGSTNWVSPFDDMTSSYTPQYAMLHGANAFTIEVPFGSQDSVEAVLFGFVGNADFISRPENKDRMFVNQLERYRRGIENIDADTLRPYYVSQADEQGGNASTFRPRREENGNFFPEYYVIPIDGESQRNRAAAADIVEYLLRNDVAVKSLTQDVSLEANEYRDSLSFKAGSIVVDMHQAKRNMAHAALYSNLTIDGWTGLYSEPVTNFPDFHDFDAVSVNTPGAFAEDMLVDVDASPEVASSVSGEGSAAIIANTTVQAILAVNALLDAGTPVGLILEGEYAGDYVVSSDSLADVADRFVIEVTKTDAVPPAKIIKSGVKVYVPGALPEYDSDETGREYGVKNYRNLLNTALAWDRFALEKQMGFALAASADEADIIVGNGALSEDEAAKVAQGKPYVGYGSVAVSSIRDAGLEVDCSLDDGDKPTKSGDFDALANVKFESDSIVTVAYAKRGDSRFYGHGGAMMTKAPDAAARLLSITNNPFVEGFMTADHVEKYKGSLQAIDCTFEGWNAVLFANSLTNKAYQLHEYRYLAAAIYSRILEGDFAL